jgi:class 3 adenylate cyclase
LDEYEPAFRDNRIDMRVLPKLTAEDLKDLGVTTIGDRRILLDAIAALREPTSPTGSAEPAPAAPIPERREATAGAEAERRQVTVMFCDLVGSTALSARLDPEDLSAVISGYHRCAAAVIERAGGFVAKYMGDGVLAYFGYPRADEHDAERAVRAGLALVAAVPRLDTEAETRLQVRVGIATGIVVVGDLIGAGAAQEQAVVGATPNLAARLQVLADPGSVVIAPSTRRLTGGLFDYEELGPLEIKGLAKPVTVARVLRDSGAESRFEALRAARTPLVGRDEELSLLQRRWEQAKIGEGSVVLVSGEPGIGKSRLAQTLLGRLSGNRIPAYARSARRITRTTRSTRRSRGSNGRLGSGARTPPISGSTSSERSSPRRPTISAKLPRSSPHCYRCLQATVIRRSTSPRSGTRSGRWARWWPRSRVWRRGTRC